MPQVDASIGYCFVAQTVYSLQKSTIATETQHHRLRGLFSCLEGIDFFALNLARGELLNDRCELLIYCKIESVMLDERKNTLDIALRVCDLGAGKK